MQYGYVFLLKLKELYNKKYNVTVGKLYLKKKKGKKISSSNQGKEQSAKN